jgi:hypothetical protein
MERARYGAVGVETPHGTHVSSTDRSVWAIGLACVAAGFAIASRGVGGATTGVLAIPNTTTGALMLTASLLLYVFGLFAPVSSRSGRSGGPWSG